MKTNAAPGSALLHPLAPFSLFVLLLNDHWLKRFHPGVLSGKLSDFAVMVLLPVLWHALFEVGYASLKRRAPSPAVANRALLGCIVLAGLVFGLPEIWKPAEHVYCVVGAWLKWPLMCLIALLRGRTPPGVVAVKATADLSDLLALSSAYLAWRVARRGPAPPRAARAWRSVIGALLSCAALSYPSHALAAGSAPHEHDRFYANLELGPALLWVHSPASLSNGFQQAIPSTSSGVAWGGNLELGGTISEGFVLGGAVGFAKAQSPVVSTLGERFELHNGELALVDVWAFARYYPNPRQGLHLGVSLGFSDLEAQRIVGNHHLQGPSLALEAGHGFWLARQWSLGLAARLTAAELSGDVPGTTVVLMPGVYATITCH